MKLIFVQKQFYYLNCNKLTILLCMISILIFLHISDNISYYMYLNTQNNFQNILLITSVQTSITVIDIHT